jgi:hypothetical protein
MTIFQAISIMEGLEESTQEQQVNAAQTLIDSRYAWILPGRIGRACAGFIEEGLCHE